MKSKTIYKSIKRDEFLIKLIERKSGWYIDWQQDYIRLSADSEEKLFNLIKYFSNFVKY